ncbi:MAG: hypothetical protein HYZ14_10930 [Bacteroidetes bacterium]|nr:hypothetical protein [Bacteroidota bacterium]
MSALIKPENVLLSYLKIKELREQLDNKENNDWMRLMHAPDYLQQELNAILKEREQNLALKRLHKLIREAEELLKTAAYHKFLNSNSVRLWSTLKSIYSSLLEFEKNLAGQ